MLFAARLGGGLIGIVLNALLVRRHGGARAATTSLIAYWMTAHGTWFLCPP
jgi:hypothetical protein